MAKKAKRAAKVYGSYRFIDKDLIIDVWRTARSDSKKTYAQIEADGGPTAGTLRSWDIGGVKRPQFCTVAAAARAIGKTGIKFRQNGTPYFTDD